MCRSLDGDDFLHRRTLHGQPARVSKHPPVGKKWLKQIFAGQMGLTLMAVFLGMQLGVPHGMHPPVLVRGTYIMTSSLRTPM